MPIRNPNDPNRRHAALARRRAAADVAFGRPHPDHEANNDEDLLGAKFPMNFTKGLPHDPNTGLVSRGADYRKFVDAIYGGDQRDFRDTPLGDQDAPQPLKTDGIDRLRTRLIDGGLAADSSQVAKIDGGIGLRAWESQSAGLSFDLEGPDAQAVTMPPAPGLCDAAGADELIAELAEVYAQALLRDVPFKYIDGTEEPPADLGVDVAAVFDALNALRHTVGFSGFDTRVVDHDLYDVSGADDETKGWIPKAIGAAGDLTAKTLFRGIILGDLRGSYLSQFLLLGNTGINGSDTSAAAEDGLVTYGAIRADLKARYAEPCIDYMTTWEEWYSVQCGANVSQLEIYADQLDAAKVSHRFITTPRDLATYVHYDALYEAYLNAALYLLGRGAALDPGLPFLAFDERDHQQGFAHFGGPHLLSLVTEVATRALKCVRFQKFNVHRRLRPEALAGRVHKLADLPVNLLNGGHDKFTEVHHALDNSGLLDLVRAHNAANNGGDDSELLPMAFTEGSPMHATYGAGHATVAGACITVLKAFFDGTQPMFADAHGNPEQHYFVPCIVDEATGESALEQVAGDEPLTIEGELNKLAANISIGRDWAGVHYYSDYLESLRMGEQIAIGILSEQKLMFGEHFHMSFLSFDGIPTSI